LNQRSFLPRGGAFLWLTLSCSIAAPQESVTQFRPELNIYVNTGERTRVLFQNNFDETPSTHTSDTRFAGFFELAMRPVLRRALRDDLDVFRQRYLTFAVGYQRIMTDEAGQTSHENRLIAETVARFPLKRGLVIVDRNRGEFRFRQGRPYSSRYRNRLRLERDCKLAGIEFTPYVYDEIFYDTRYGAWSVNRMAAGLQIVAGPRMIWEPYFMRQHDMRGSPRFTNGIGLKLSLYL
jgi:hypothetical protein